MTYDVPVQMTVSEGFGPIPVPSPQILIINAEAQNIGGYDFLVLDKTFSEICDAPFAVVKYGASEWGSGHGIKASWYVYDVYEYERRVRVITMNGNTPTIVTFDALSDDDYPKIAL